MSQGNGGGYVQLRRGILDHCQQGKLPPLHFAAYVHLILEADKESGVVWSSAKSLALTYGYHDRYSRQIIERLEQNRYIRRFTTPGSHGEYPILVHKYVASRGARKGLMLDAWKSTDWRHLVFEKCQETCEGTCEDNASYQEGEVLNTTTPDSQTNPGQKVHIQLQPQNSNGKRHDDSFENIARALVPFYLKTVNRTRYDIEAQSELSPKSTRLQFVAAKAKEISERIVLQEAPGLDEPTMLRNTQSAMEHVLVVFSRNEWRATEGRKFNGLEYAFRDFGRIESALEESV